MVVYTGTTGDDIFSTNNPDAYDTFAGDDGTDTLVLGVSSSPIAVPGGLLSAYSFYSSTTTPQTSLNSVERLVFDSKPGNWVSAYFDMAAFRSSGLTDLVGGPGRDSTTFASTDVSSATMPTLRLTGFDPVSANAWNATGDFLTLSAKQEQPNQAYTLNAANGLNVLQRIVGGQGNDTINGSTNADVLSIRMTDSFSTGMGVDHLNGFDGNDSLEIVAPFSSSESYLTVSTNANAVFDGGTGTDVLTIGGGVLFASTMTSIEGVNLLPAFTSPVDATGAARLVIDSEHLAMLPSDAFFTGTGLVQILTNGTGFDGSHFTITPGSNVRFSIFGHEGDGCVYLGTPGDDTMNFGDGTQSASGGVGADVFVIAPDYGNETVTDFTPGDDKIDLSELGLYNLRQVLSFGRQVGADAVFELQIDDMTDALTLTNVQLNALTMSDFILAEAPPIGSEYLLNTDKIGDILLRRRDGLFGAWTLSEDQKISDRLLFSPATKGSSLTTFVPYGILSQPLFQGSNGALLLDTLVSESAVGHLQPQYAVVGAGDIDGDETSEVVLLDAVTGTYAFWRPVIGGEVDTTSIGAPGSNLTYKATGDFNGDGMADILFQNVNGGYATWQLNNGTVAGGGDIGNPGKGWFFKGIGDFNGDTITDILFENANGQYATWDMDGTHIIGGGTLGNPGGTYAFATINDYNGDGKDDILFRAADGTLATWLLDDTVIIGGATLGNPGSDYSLALPHGANTFANVVFANTSTSTVASWEVGTNTVVGGGTFGTPGTQWTALATGDFAGTRETDVLFRNTAGTYATWTTEGSTLIGGGTIGTPGGDYKYLAAADFNGDGRTDILFYNKTTSIYATWDLDGSTIIGGGNIGVASGYGFAATGDINGDGKADVIFKDGFGKFAAWEISDTAIVGGGAIGNPGAGWYLKGMGDFNGDGKADMLFENTSGVYATWDLHGTAIVGGGTLGDPGGSFQLTKVIDLNQDGRADLLFKDASGNYASWLIADTTIIGGGNLGGVSNSFHVI